jgi:two-component system, cell cycle sensor histidine kinase and response regulator CckA
MIDDRAGSKKSDVLKSAFDGQASWKALAAILVVLLGGGGLVYWIGAKEAFSGALLAAALAVLFGGIAATFAWKLGQRKEGVKAANLLRATAGDSADACFVIAPNGSLAYANGVYGRMFAQTADWDALPLETVAAALAGEEDREFLERLILNAASGVTCDAELSFAAPSGFCGWGRISALPLKSLPRLGKSEGPFVAWRIEDITARREVAQARAKEEEMMADFLDYLPAGFFSADGDGRILYANKTLADWLGIAPKDGASEKPLFADFVVASSPAPEGYTSTSDTALHGEVTLVSEEGETFRACLVQSQKMDENGALAYSRSVVLRDMEWSQEEDLEKNPAQRLHWLFDEAPVGILLLDLQGNVTDCNRAFLKLLGLHREAVVGHPFASKLAKEDRADAAVQLSKVVMGIMRAAHLEVRMPGVGEKELVTSLYASRMENDLGEVSGLVLHFIDTTEQKHLEVQFAQSQKMQAVGQLAGGVAHDFNNLLTAMIGFCDLLLEKHGAGDPSFSDIMQIKQNANRATNLVRQLLAFSRKQTLQPVILNVTEALSDMSQLLGRLIGETIELKMEHAGDLGAVRVDPGQFDQVIINLAVNARDAMSGGGVLSIRTTDVSLNEAVQKGHEVMPRGRYVLIEVIDTGVGIAKEDISRIFEPFFSTKEVGAGTGLGLSTVYGIVHQTDGFVFVDSAPGEGSAFSVYLPRYETEGMSEGAELSVVQEAPASQRTEESDEDLTGSGSVLLVEDEDAVRMFGARALRNKGYKVLEAENGEGALDVINNADQTIDIIVSDVVMPGMDGYTLIQLVRQELPKVKVILMSGYTEDAFAEEIDGDPTIHFLPKPFSLKVLASKVKDVMLEKA